MPRGCEITKGMGVNPPGAAFAGTELQRGRGMVISVAVLGGDLAAGFEIASRRDRVSSRDSHPMAQENTRILFLHYWVGAH